MVESAERDLAGLGVDRAIFQIFSDKMSAVQIEGNGGKSPPIPAEHPVEKGVAARTVREHDRRTLSFGLLRHSDKRKRLAPGAVHVGHEIPRPHVAGQRGKADLLKGRPGKILRPVQPVLVLRL